MKEYAELFKASSSKSVSQFVIDFKTVLMEKGFQINNEDKMEMARNFASHGVTMEAGFDLYMIQICKPEKASDSLKKNLERAALMPKFVTVFSADGKTQVRFLRYSPEMIETLIQDPEFAVSIGTIYKALEQMIKAAA